MKRALITTGIFLLFYVILTIIVFRFIPDKFNWINVISSIFGSLLGIFIVRLIEEKKKEKNKKLHF